jgi:hypothetical protein
MTGVISVAIVIDTQSILETHPDPSQDPSAPTAIADNCCYLVAQTAYVSRGQATAHLHIKAHNGGADDDLTHALRTIRWRSLSLSGSAGHNVIVYNVIMLSRMSVAGPIAAVMAQPEIPLPILEDSRNTDPPSFSSVPANDYFLEAKVTNNGTERFGVCFYITAQDEQTGVPATVGYFGWHPTLTIV